MYLLKLYTNHTLRQIAPHFKMPISKVSTWIRKMRKLAHAAIVPLYLSNRRRNQLLENTSPLSRRIYGANNDKVVLTVDGTYVFTIKSSNFEFQKKSYSKQFKRNLVKFMLFVTTNGLIAALYGPFEARKNDATILEEILNKPENIFQELRVGDVIVVDRGFREVIGALRNLGLIVKSPKGTKENKLTRDDANESRFATKTRYVVEVRNSHIKNKYKYLSDTKLYQSIPYLKMDFELCAALVNAFCRKIVSDKDDWRKIGDLMLAKRNEPNNLSILVRHIPDKFHRRVNNLTLFPKLKFKDLKEICQGSYQIRLAKSYCHSHVKANNDMFPMDVCNDINILRKYFGKLLTMSRLLLLRLDSFSRFQSNKSHKTYVLLDFFEKKFTLKSYCCSCRHGCRTVGCCSHVMLVIWYTLYINHNNLRKKFPSANLDYVFDGSEVELETESESDSSVVSNSTDDSNSDSNDSSDSSNDSLV